MCTCEKRSGIIAIPSGRIICGDCHELIEELPKKQERP